MATFFLSDSSLSRLFYLSTLLFLVHCSASQTIRLADSASGDKIPFVPTFLSLDSSGTLRETPRPD